MKMNLINKFSTFFISCKKRIGNNSDFFIKSYSYLEKTLLNYFDKSSVRNYNKLKEGLGSGINELPKFWDKLNTKEKFLMFEECASDQAKKDFVS